MTEWYVYCEWGVPKFIALGRREALEHLTRGRAIPPESIRQFRTFLEIGVPDLYTPISFWSEHQFRGYERSITRVVGPGTEV